MHCVIRFIRNNVWANDLLFFKHIKKFCIKNNNKKKFLKINHALPNLPYLIMTDILYFISEVIVCAKLPKTLSNRREKVFQSIVEKIMETKRNISIYFS